MAPKKSAPVVAKVQKSADQLLAEQIAAEQELPHREAQLYKQLIVCECSRCGFMVEIL